MHSSGLRAGLRDSHGRTIDYMRLSLTDRCNFRCVYCMPPEGEAFIPHDEILSYEEFLRLCRITAALGISRYKITGGEPLCRKGAVDFIRELKHISGVEQVTLTTNGSLLAAHAKQLADAGIDGINVSLDSLSQDAFSTITRSTARIADILDAMQTVKNVGIRIKINVVPLLTYNKSDLMALTEFALEQGYHIRFIEIMPVGEGKAYEGIAQEKIREMVAEKFGALTPLPHAIGNGPAECFSVPHFQGSVGFISALSKKFCHTCNRVRLTSLGFLKTCLHHNKGTDLKPLLRGAATDDALKAAITQAVAHKPKAHDFAQHPEQSEEQDFFMNSVGG